MAATSAVNVILSVAGTSTATTGAATTDAGAHTVYQITTAARRVIDPATAVTVKKDGVAQSSSLYTIDYLFGKVTFASALGGGNVVTMDYSYLPLETITVAHEFSFKVTNTIADITPHGATSAERTKLPCLADFECSFGLFDDLYADYGGGATSLASAVYNKTPTFVDIQPGTTSDNHVRAWVILEGETKGTPEGVIMSSVTGKAAQKNSSAPFGSGT